MATLSLCDYPLGVLENLMSTKGKQATDRKLTAYGYEYSSSGRGKTRVYTITALPDAFHQFRSFCVFSLGFDPNTDFRKLRDFVVYLFADEDFNWRPEEAMEEYLRLEGRGISRQTIASYKKRLEAHYIIDTVFGDFVYYKVYKKFGAQTHEVITKEEYSKAWRLYWQWREEHPEDDSTPAYSFMYSIFGGVPRKQRRIQDNLFGKEKADILYDLAVKSILDEVAD